jgi:hypothetical protein
MAAAAAAAAAVTSGNALEVARMPGVLKQWEGVAQIISRRMDMERKYLHRLEGILNITTTSTANALARSSQLLTCRHMVLFGHDTGQKGSDVSAKEATRKLLAATKQLDALSALITQVTTEAQAHGIQVSMLQARVSLVLA